MIMGSLPSEGSGWTYIYIKQHTNPPGCLIYILNNLQPFRLPTAKLDILSKLEVELPEHFVTGCLRTPNLINKCVVES